jgi:acyl carrier protein
MSDLENELKQVIVECLLLEDVTAESIDTDAPLFGEGLALDSIDALELGMGLARKYGFKIEPKDPRTREAFQSVRSLAAFVREHRAPAEGTP